MFGGIKHRVQDTARRAAIGAAASVLLAVGIGFLTAAAFIGIAAATSVLTACIVIGIGYVGLGLIAAGFMAFDGFGKPKPAEPQHTAINLAPYMALATAFIQGMSAGRGARR